MTEPDAEAFAKADAIVDLMRAVRRCLKAGLTPRHITELVEYRVDADG